MSTEGFQVHLIDETASRLNTHEAVCAHRYDQIMDSFTKGEKRMTRMEYILYAVIAAILFGPGVFLELFKNLLTG